MRLVLASTSPRRREILALLGLPFEVIAPKFTEEVLSHRPVADEVVELALGKAQSVALDDPADIVIGSDTMILLGLEKIGKPATAAHAKAILRALSGKTHRIYTSVAILDRSGPGLTAVEEVAVEMREYSEADIDRYLSFDESFDKAGAYSIQGEGRALIERIDGDYLAAVGLPLKPIAAYLRERGVAVPLDVERLYAERSFRNWRSF
jgi:septum formation protein